MLVSHCSVKMADERTAKIYSNHEGKYSITILKSHKISKSAFLSLENSKYTLFSKFEQLLIK